MLNSLQHFELLSCSIQEIIRWVSELHNDLQSYIVPKELLWGMVDHTSAQQAHAVHKKGRKACQEPKDGPRRLSQKLCG